MRKKLSENERSELKCMLLGMCSGYINNMLSIDESLWRLKLIELQKQLFDGLNALHYGLHE